MLTVAGRPREGFQAVLKCLQSVGLIALFWAPIASASDYFSCTPSTRVFSTGGALALTEDLKKLSRREFGFDEMTPSGNPVLARGTELNVLVDQSCLRSRGPHAMQWLRGIKTRGAGVRSFAWKLERETDFAELQTAFEEEPCVVLVAPNSVFRVSSAYGDAYADPLEAKQEHLRFLKYDEAMTDFIKPLLVRKRVTIAVIDSGVDFSHPDLYENRWINPREIAGNGLDDDGNGYIDDVSGYNFAADIGDPAPQGEQAESRHGTHVAGLAAGRLNNGAGITGVNGVAQIMGVNIFGANRTTRSVLLENALRFAADNGADVINMSLGGREYSRSMRSALEYAVSKGAFIVSAAGNYGMEICDDPETFGFVSPAVYAASIEGMIVTGSVDAIDGGLSIFSNYSPRLVEIAAPGAYSSLSKVGLLSTVPREGYEYLAGTSMAAPVLSGSAALAISWLKVYDYPISPAGVETILKSSARRENSLLPWIQEGRTLDLASLAKYLKKNYPRPTALD